jgi:phospholipid/cholesterol/gamma-HCH transport system substrate-binding protein
MQKRNLTVGIFLVAGVALFTLGLFLIGSQHKVFARHFEVYAEFADIHGLTKGGKVRVAGLDAGEVVDIAVPRSPTAKFRLRLRLEEGVHAIVRADSTVTIATEGVVGDKFLLIHAGSTQAAEAASGATLPSKEPLDMADLMEKSAGLLSGAGGAMKTTGQKLNETLDTANMTMRNANDLIVGLKQGKGTAGMLLHDETTATRIRQSIENVHQATASLNQTARRADGLVSDLQSRQLGQKAEETISSARTATQNINATSQRVRQTVNDALGPDDRGVDTATNIRQSVSNLNQATQNMADDMEALKRNFFFRGFFKRRGYYSLSHLSQDQYRKDKLFSDSRNHRDWFEAGDLFQADPNGLEALSPEGKAHIDAAMAELSGSLGASPLIIEGYSAAQSPADELAASRNRAILVRDYIRRRFHFDAQDVVIESLGNRPPAGTGKDRWDGACILLLQTNSR